MHLARRPSLPSIRLQRFNDDRNIGIEPLIIGGQIVTVVGQTCGNAGPIRTDVRVVGEGIGNVMSILWRHLRFGRLQMPLMAAYSHWAPI